MLKSVRELPLCAITEFTFYRTTDYFRDHGNAVMQCSTRFSSRVELTITKRRTKASSTVLGYLTWATTNFEVSAAVGMHQDTVPRTPSNNIRLVPRRSSAHAISQNYTIFHAPMYLWLART